MSSIMSKKVIYPEVELYAYRNGYNMTSLARKIGEDWHTLRRKLQGRTEVKLWEAIAIKHALHYDGPIETLFSTEDKPE